jgi:ABC-type Zn uptake system ZnuABC Zn-binding protein ZnuA
VRVVTTTSVFADMVTQVGGELVQVTSLVPHNGDVHTFEPRPSDIRSVADARLLIMNGLGLDDWLAKTIRNAADEGVPLIRLAEDLPGAEPLPGEEAGTRNPHLFLDVAYARGYVGRIAAALKQVDPQHADRYDARASAYLAELDALDGWVRQQVQTIPEANRKIVTFHDAFAYYARAYGLQVVGVAVRAPGQDPSAGYIARLVDAVEVNGVKAIFSERQFPATLADQIAAETGARVVANLYDDSLGDPPVTTYVAMVRWDTEQIVRGLA